MSGDPLDMSGSWDGVYRYPGQHGPDTPFVCRIEEQAGHLSGTIMEPDAIYGAAVTLDARLIGHRAGRSVDFVKTYSGQRLGYENPVDYVGQLSADGLSVTGSWSLCEFDGTFEMTRDRAATVAVIEEQVADVPIAR